MKMPNKGYVSTLPEGRLQCSDCGFMATKTEFHKKHKRCWPEIIGKGVVLYGCLILTTLVMLSILEYYDKL